MPGSRNTSGSAGAAFLAAALLAGTQAPADDNAAWLEQDGTSNSAEVLQQSGSRNEAGRDDRPMQQSGAGNRLYIEQGGGNGNLVASVLQDSINSDHGNKASVTMTGAGNRLEILSQVTQGSDASGRNTAELVIEGDKSNTSAFTAGLNDFALDAGAEAGTIRQGAFDGGPDHGNTLDLRVEGSRTVFGVEQIGTGNIAKPLTITGDDNEFGLVQDGDRNKVVAGITGNGNILGVRQLGFENTAEIFVEDNDNTFGVLQNGAGNLVSLNIDGNNNGQADGTGDPDAIFAGAALDAAEASSPFERGMVKQIGNSNSVTHRVTGWNNAFGFLQDGSDNEIVGLQDGHTNQAAVVQIGSDNATDFTQIGAFNIVGVVQ
ncbi:MAG: hypothetical protein ACLFVH_13975 [Phycisphaerae bacterium]